MKKENMLTTSEAAEYIRFSRSSLETWRQKNEGPKFINLKGKVFYLKEDLDAWIESCAAVGGLV